MSLKSHFFDLDCLVTIDQKAWFVDKNKPSVPLMKISSSDLRLIKSGIYYKQGNKIEFNGNTFYLPEEMANKLKVIAVRTNTNYANIAISLKEYLDKEEIEKLNFSLNLSPILDIKNTKGDIYIICSERTKNNTEKIVQEIIEKLKQNGLVIKNFYFLNENLMNQDTDEVKFKKMRLLIQHLLGYKTDDRKFTNNTITKYDEVHYYDNKLHTFEILDKILDLLQLLINNTEKGLKDVIKDDLEDDRPLLCVHKISDNKSNPISLRKVFISLKRLITKFESFNPFL